MKMMAWVKIVRHKSEWGRNRDERKQYMQVSTRWNEKGYDMRDKHVREMRKWQGGWIHTLNCLDKDMTDPHFI